MKKQKHSEYVVLAIFGLIVMSGVYFRLTNLDLASMESDKMEYYKIALRGISPSALMHDSTRYIGSYIPFWFALNNFFLQTLDLNVTFLSVRLLTAITGVLCILAFMGLGFSYGGKRTGFLMALFAALHPIHIQMSRDGYYYAPIVLGVVFILWGIFRLIQDIEKGQELPLSCYPLFWVGFVLTSYISPVTWPLLFVSLLAIYYSLTVELWQRKVGGWRISILTVGFLILGLPLLIYPWGIRWALWNIGDEEYVSYWRQVMGDKSLRDVLTAGTLYLSSFGFGRGGLRATANAITLILAIWYACVHWKQDRKTRVFTTILVGSLALFVFAYMKSPEGLGLRRFSSHFPLIIVILCMGYRQTVEFAKKHGGRYARHIPNVIFMLYSVFIVSTFGRAAWLATQIKGGPHKNISLWCDANLRQGTLVLSDHWQTPWNQLQVNPSTNVYHTFTFPNLTPNEYMKGQWREGAMRFMCDNPFAAYYESKNLWKRLGPWIEPHARFSRRVDFVDDAHVMLSRIGLSYENPLDLDFPVEQQTVSVYYNTDADVIERAKREGRRTLQGFGEGWRYLKAWQPMQGWPEPLMQALWIQAGMYAEGGKAVASLADLQKLPQQQANGYLNQGRWADYRIPGSRSPLRLFNLTDADLEATLTVTGIALSGNVRCMIGDQAVVFPQTLLVERKVPLTLKPGENEVAVSLPANQLMLVYDVRLNSAEGSP